MIRRTHPYISSPLAFLIMLALLTVWLDYITRPAEYVKDDTLRNPDYLIESLTGVRVDFEQGIERRFSAQKLLHYFNEEITQLEQTSFIHSDPGKPPMRISADHAVVRDKGKDIDLSGNVIAVRGAEGDKNKIMLATDFMHLDPKASRVATDHDVTLSRSNSKIMAKGLEYDARAGEMKLLSAVRAVNYK